MGQESRIGGIAAAVLGAIVLALIATVISMATERTSRSEVPVGQTVSASGEDWTEEEEQSELPLPEQALLYESLGNGTCAVIGIGACRESFVAVPKTSPSGERVVRICAKAFYGCDQITAVQIPETVREIGTMAFANCRNLVRISVSPENLYYTDLDGVLYTADRRALLAYPPMRAVNPAVISGSVTSIAEMAFCNCRYLTCVRYEGSAEEWDRISIGARNYSLSAASMEFLEDSVP